MIQGWPSPSPHVLPFCPTHHWTFSGKPFCSVAPWAFSTSSWWFRTQTRGSHRKKITASWWFMVSNFIPGPRWPRIDVLVDVSAQPTPSQPGGQIFPSLAEITKASNIGQVVPASLQAHVTCGRGHRYPKISWGSRTCLNDFLMVVGSGWTNWWFPSLQHILIVFWSHPKREGIMITHTHVAYACLCRNRSKETTCDTVYISRPLSGLSMKMPLSLGSTWWEVSAIRFDSVTSKGKGTSKQKLKSPISFHQIVRLLFKPHSFVAQIPYRIMWKTANPMPQSHKSPLWECVFNEKTTHCWWVIGNGL